MADKLGPYLRSLRGTQSLRAVADKTNGKLSHSYISDLEKGKSRRGNIIKPTPETLKILAEVYETDYDHLMRLAGYIDNNSDPDKPEYVDLKEQINDKKKIMTFEGRIISDEDLEYMERLLRGGKKD
ncbi:helix-turn-helix domain-containing protein [Levilactobacillus brevis]|uniref:helix-turn-helix domain-containing protein n=1 Tax=Levilactobacillus brevis TaxID=1580 RepID=UPI000A202513|nr:helix-turn-helix transcriptional regulator [Levilactobacillus brevis]ARN89783.1 hypothetical protein AZI09_04305 [Levilactobacillus brevis]ARN97367.1 hypothetical protein AZI10_04285 [Levilactobacillus brevis]ARN97430.1 hypothetical protein AZI10_04640 [Levilactobacillus brevis]